MTRGTPMPEAMSDGSELERALGYLRSTINPDKWGDVNPAGLVESIVEVARLIAREEIAARDPVAIIECEDCNARVLDFNAPKPRSETASASAGGGDKRSTEEEQRQMFIGAEYVAALLGEVLESPAHAAPEAGGDRHELVARFWYFLPNDIIRNEFALSVEAALRDAASLREAMGRAPRPHPSEFDQVAYMDWYFTIRASALSAPASGGTLPSDSKETDNPSTGRAET